ncbi:MAG: hypothetical protein JXR61_12675 [Prolixibacteraceae bacterium]|nr:hypothetical protein [Prolixibacteraceae bacterium]
MTLVRIVNQNVYYGNCGGASKQGVEINEIILDSLNDMRIEGFSNAMLLYGASLAVAAPFQLVILSFHCR